MSANSGTYRVQTRYSAAFEQLKYCNSQQISDILADAYDDGLLVITGGMFDKEDVDECRVALMMAIDMLRKSNITLR